MLKWGSILLFLPSVILVTLYTIEVQDVAHCTKISGSWDFIKGVCDLEKEHEYMTYMSRHGSWVNYSMLISIVGLAMLTWGMILRGMASPKDD